MKFSIVVPSFNQAQYLEDCLDSILMQRGVEKEIIVMDGGSTDGSVDIIRRYEPHLAYWQSQPDGGQSAALNAGFARATGDVFAWLCSDDYYMPGALAHAQREWSIKQVDILHGSAIFLNEATRESVIRGPAREPFFEPTVICPFVQPSTFFSRATFESVGPLREDLHYCFDWEYWLRCRNQRRTHLEVDSCWSVFRFHGLNKTTSGSDRVAEETKHVRESYMSAELRSARQVVRSKYSIVLRLLSLERRTRQPVGKYVYAYLRRLGTGSDMGMHRAALELEGIRLGDASDYLTLPWDTNG